MLEIPSERWFALCVEVQREKTAATALRNLGFEEFLPQYPVRRAWSDRVKSLETPLFPGYLFCRFAFEDRTRVLNAAWVRSIVRFGPLPTPVPDEQVESIRRMLSSGLPVQPWPYLEAGQRVRIEQGPLRGLEGALLGIKGVWRVVVSVELLQRSVAVEIDRDQVFPIPQKVVTLPVRTVRAGMTA
jgi:transcription antitermination factor NusG